MAFQQNFDAYTPTSAGSDRDVARKQKPNQIPPVNPNECFDCNICLDSSHDPVVTLCGHLYCWPCIYKWLEVESMSFESNDRPKCPVCKAYISTSSLIPLYGRGRSASESDTKKPQLNLTIPHRPPALGINALFAAATPFPSDPNPRNNPIPQHYISHPFSNQTTPAFGSLSTTRTTFSPTINMVGDMVFAGMSGSSLFTHPYPGNSSPRLRRQEMLLDKSLNRVSIFLFCCIALCLILF